MVDCDGMKCFLFDGCPGRTGVCYSCGPDGNECPVYRWFKEKLFKEQPEIVRCKDCKYWRPNTEFCGRWTFGWIAHRTPPNWYCADGEVKQDAANG